VAGPIATPVPSRLRAYYSALLRDLAFGAEPSAHGAAVALVWQPPMVPSAPPPESPPPVERSSTRRAVLAISDAVALETSTRAVVEVAPAQTGLPLRILRRERRFPGLSRRGFVPLLASSDDLGDGTVVFDSATFTWDLEETRSEQLDQGHREIVHRYRMPGEPRDRVLLQTITTDYAADGQALQQLVRFFDRGLEPGTIYYYTVFAGAPLAFSRATQFSALATGDWGHRLFLQLPGIHQRLDTERPAPGTVALADLGKGQLERFLDNLDEHADMLQGMVDGLRDLHAVRRADSRVLPLLAHLLGWELKDYLDEDGQRTEIRFAAELYRAVGTFPSAVALVNRLTRWDANLREFARSVVVTFDATRVEQVESGQVVYLDGSLAPTQGYLDWLDGAAQNEPAPPHFTGRRVPAGTVDTADADAMFALRTRAFDDPTAYTYDCGQPDGAGGYVQDNNTWYNRQTVGVFIVPLGEEDSFTIAEEWERVQQILTGFLPAQVRMVFVLAPGLTIEEPYDATQQVIEEEVGTGEDSQDDTYGEGTDTAADTIPQWRWFVSNRLNDKTVNVNSIDLGARTWHTGVSQSS
jgi:phage tail-like protein